MTHNFTREGKMMMGRREMGVQALRIAVTIVIGTTLLGCGYVFLFTPGFFSNNTYFTLTRPLTKSDPQVNTSSCESTEKVNILKSKMMELADKNAELEKKVMELTSKKKAGPFGTVKSTSTNPTVFPDESLNPRLAKILQEIAIKKELIVSLANSNVKDMLQIWFTRIKKVGITNYLVVALDDNIADFCKENNVPFYKKDPDNTGIDSVGKTGGTLTVSGLKFSVLREFLQMGYSVLLSDIDIVYLQNPFDYLYRDSDIESMTDGHSNETAYGYNDVFYGPEMGWSTIVYTTRIWVYNSGFFYIRPTFPAIELLDRVADRLGKWGGWDQAIFNEELWYPSRPGYVGVYGSRRTMDFYLFMNSKVLFKFVRNDENLKKFRPVVVHVNYHHDKLVRMKAVVEFYVNGKEDALDSLPLGS